MAERTSERAGRPVVAVVADGLTASRLVLAGLIVVAFGADALAAGTWVLCAAWATDFFDGRLARRAAGATRLGRWDPHADATVGLGVLVGLSIAGRIAVFPWLVVGATLVAGLFVVENLSLGMIAQAMAYGLLIVELAADAPQALWIFATTVALIGVADARRLATEILPTFFSGIGLGGRGTDSDTELR